MSEKSCRKSGVSGPGGEDVVELRSTGEEETNFKHTKGKRSIYTMTKELLIYRQWHQYISKKKKHLNSQDSRIGLSSPLDTFYIYSLESSSLHKICCSSASLFIVGQICPLAAKPRRQGRVDQSCGSYLRRAPPSKQRQPQLCFIQNLIPPH